MTSIPEEATDIYKFDQKRWKTNERSDVVDEKNNKLGSDEKE